MEHFREDNFMHKIYRQTICSVLAVLLFVCAVLGGCQVKRPAATPQTTQVPYQEENTDNYEHYEERSLEEQTRFKKEMEELFISEVSDTQVNLHFMLKDPSRYGITHARNLYPSMSQEVLDQNLQSQQELGGLLDSFDPALLTEDQRMTLRIWP